MCVEHAIQVVVGQRHPVPAHQVWIVDAPQKCGHFSESCNVRARSKEDGRNLRGSQRARNTRRNSEQEGQGGAKSLFIPSGRATIRRRQRGPGMGQAYDVQVLHQEEGDAG